MPPLSHPAWSKTTLRASDPSKSIRYYVEKLAFTHLSTSSTSSFLTTLPSKHGPHPPDPKSEEANDFRAGYPGVCLELLHPPPSSPSTPEAAPPYNPGNGVNDGFGHIACNCSDVYASSKELEEGGVAFKKRPDEGRMKGLAFCLDPDNYWVELVKRGEGSSGIGNAYNFSQTMLRVKDPKLSVPFYESLGMKVIDSRHFGEGQGNFSLYFMGTPMEGEVFPDQEGGNDFERREFLKNRFEPVLELTHNHGTEDDAAFKYNTGGADNPADGFVGLGFLVDDVTEFLAASSGRLEGLKEDGGKTFIKDPDGYSIEIMGRAE